MRRTPHLQAGSEFRQQSRPLRTRDAFHALLGVLKRLFPGYFSLMNRLRCLAGIAASYLPALACAAVIGAVCAFAGDLRTVIWLLAAAIIGYLFMYVTSGRGA